MKSELEVAKKAHTVLENKIKSKKNEITHMKQELKGLRSENEIFKRVIYDGKGEETPMSKEGINKSIANIMSESGDEKAKIAKSKFMIFNDSYSSNDGETRNVGILTDGCKKKDNFMQTEAHGFVEIQDIIRRNSLINLNRRMSSNNTLNHLKTHNDSISPKYMNSANSLNNYKFPSQTPKNSQNSKNSKKSQNSRKSKNSKNSLNYQKSLNSQNSANFGVTPISRNLENMGNFGTSQNSQNSDFSSVSQQTDPRTTKRNPNELAKIVISPLEKVTTIKASETPRGKRVVSKVVEVVSPQIENSRAPQTASKPFKGSQNPQGMFLSGVKVKQLKSSHKFKRTLPSVSNEIKSTLMSERISRNTSTEEVPGAMDAVYETGKP